MNTCKIKSQLLRQSLEGLKQKRKQWPHGSMEEKVVALRKRFFSKVEKTGNCWIWKRSKTKSGYGVFNLSGKFIRAHRFSWLWHNGDISKGICVCHSCDNPICVNPKHLWLGTPTQNNLDRDKKGRTSKNPYGEKNSNAKLTNEEAFAIRKIYSLGKTNTEKLSVLFKVSRYSIRQIVENKSYPQPKDSHEA